MYYVVMVSDAGWLNTVRQHTVKVRCVDDDCSDHVVKNFRGTGAIYDASLWAEDFDLGLPSTEVGNVRNYGPFPGDAPDSEGSLAVRVFGRDVTQEPDEYCECGCTAVNEHGRCHSCDCIAGEVHYLPTGNSYTEKGG